MSYFWKVNGEPSCVSELTLDMRLAPATHCTHTTREGVEAETTRFSKLYPEADVEIVEGHCDRGDGDRDEDYDFVKLGAPLKSLLISTCDQCPFSRGSDPMPRYCANPELKYIEGKKPVGAGGPNTPPTECPLRIVPLTLEIQD